jgi:hypothetical protein
MAAPPAPEAATPLANQNCLNDCAASHQACMSQITASDPQKTQERARECSQRMNDCQRSCM